MSAQPDPSASRPLPDDPAVLVVGGGGGLPGVRLPVGHLVTAWGAPRPGAGPAARGPVCWLSAGPVPAGLWGQLRSAHRRSGLWPLLVFDGVGGSAFGLYAEDAAAVDSIDLVTLLPQWWAGLGDGFLTRADLRALGLAGRWWQGRRRRDLGWPGAAPAGVAATDPDRLADTTADRLAVTADSWAAAATEQAVDVPDAGRPADVPAGDRLLDVPAAGDVRGGAAAPVPATSPTDPVAAAPATSPTGPVAADPTAADPTAAVPVPAVPVPAVPVPAVPVPTDPAAAAAGEVAGDMVGLALVACARGADALAVAGWCPSDGDPYVPVMLAAVVRSWEDRFGARVVGVGRGSLLLSVAAPPVTLDQAARVAVEHFAFCPFAEPPLGFDHDIDGTTFLEYARSIVGRTTWYFSWT